MEKNLCRFCDIVMNYNNGNIQHIYNNPLFESENFLVLPALGSLVPGYIMIITKHHIPSMAYLNLKELNELIELVNYLKKILYEEYNIEPILFEHGSAVGLIQESACSVEHAHWHLAPIKFANEEKIIAEMDAQKVANLRDLSSFRGKTYLLYVNNNQHYVSNMTTLSSQYMRKWIAKEIGHSDKWNWRENELLDNIALTVSEFKKYRKHTN